MPLMPNVGTGQVIQSTWGNEIRDRTRQIFANKAELDAQWPAASNGAHALTVAEATAWDRVAGAWKPVVARELVYSAVGGALTTSAEAWFGSVVITPGPTYPYRAWFSTNVRYVNLTGLATNTVRYNVTGTAIQFADPTVRTTIYSGIHGSLHSSGFIDRPAGGPLTVGWFISGGPVTLDSTNPIQTQLMVSVRPM